MGSRVHRSQIDIVLGFGVALLLGWALAKGMSTSSAQVSPDFTMELPARVIAGVPLQIQLAANGFPAPVFRCSHSGIEVTPGGMLYWQVPVRGRHLIRLEAVNSSGMAIHLWEVQVEPAPQVRPLPVERLSGTSTEMRHSSRG